MSNSQSSVSKKYYKGSCSDIYKMSNSQSSVSKKNLPAMQKTWFWFLGWEDPLEKEMATHSSILAWKIP